ncbi:ABC-2 type transport system ATP-binding protein [Frankia sp. Hr75.2]|nr:ABC transporter ATP-binding protein [Parafrankia sp. BMG5.11]CAI7977607.1 ABC-2 type transport system ATP-binding protein [Frankia sp. Hr75.2]SQD95461.1 ABC transporter related [Parafrankia sp. Ea1.12]
MGVPPSSSPFGDHDVHSPEGDHSDDADDDLIRHAMTASTPAEPARRQAAPSDTGRGGATSTVPSDTRRRGGATSTAPARGRHRGSRPVPSDTAVWTRGLSKRYGERRVVDHLDLRVPVGALSGFVGPNGAGKSTTLRMLLGLVRPTEGQAYVLGEPVSAPDQYLDRTGAMIEGPTFHPGLSGRRNLDQLALLRGLGRSHRAGGASRHGAVGAGAAGPGRRGRRDRVAEVLDQVGLSTRADDRFSTYSLGMKQRLGIAAALLPNPDLLILDEPTNGLDPAGIREIRTLLRDLAGTGMTVFVSSHLLSEVEQICDHLVMIRNGRMLFQGHVAELLAAEDPRILMVPERDDDAVRLAGVLGAAGLRIEIEMAGGSRPMPAMVERHPVVVAHAPEGLAPDINRLAMRAGITLRSIRTHRPNLEETFLKATGDVDGDLTMRGGAT